MDAVELYRRGVAEFDRRMSAVDDSQWDAPTPCTEWSVRDLVNHIVGEDRWLPPLLAGASPEEVGDRFEGDLLGESPRAAWAEARDEALAATAGLDLDQPVHTSMGQIPARELLGQMFGDHLIHAWDLAKGTGGDTRLDPELVETLTEMVVPHQEMMKASGLFGEHIEPPADADAQERLLAVFGRRP